MTEQCHCLHDINKRTCVHKDFCTKIRQLTKQVNDLTKRSEDYLVIYQEMERKLNNIKPEK